MDERNGSDLPRPRKKPSPVPPEKPAHREDSPGKAQPAGRPAPQRKAAKPANAAPERSSSRQRYDRDTEEITIPPERYAREDAPYYDEVPHRTASPQHPPRREPERRRSAHQDAPRQRPYQEMPAAPRKRRRKKSLLGRLLRGVLIFVAVVFGLYSLLSLALISRLEKVPKGERTVTTGQLAASYTRSVLLIGTDSRDLTQERGRSDSMILLTINSRTDRIYLTSFMRDMYVEIPGHGSNKLNAAYSYGGPELLMDTLELNFNIRIDDYLCVSFTGFAGVIDAFGGVEITLSDAEAQAVNDILRNEVNALLGDDPSADMLPGGGTYQLNGKQALSYARVRYVGNADFERTSRQREVMSKLLQSAKSRLVTGAPELIQDAMPNFTTNMNTGELYLLSLRAPLVLGYQMEQQQIPADGTWSGAQIGGQDVLQVDFSANQNLLRETVFGTQVPSAEE